MSIKSKYRYLLTGAIVFCILYIFLALRPLGTELNLKPEWTEDISFVSTKKDGDIPIPFRLGQNLGYFTSDGRILSSISFPVKSSISDCYYTTFSLDNSSTSFYTPDGVKAGTIKAFGFPYFCENRIYVMLPGGSSFIQCDNNGLTKWQYDGFSPITSFGTSENGTVVGFADGTITSFTPEGDISQNYKPGGSKIDVILGSAISHDGQKVASLSGLNRQRFVISENLNNHNKIIFHEYVENDLNTQALIKFSSDDSTVYYEKKNSVGIVNIQKSKSTQIQIKGSVIQIEESPSTNLVYILSKSNNEYTVTIVEPFDNMAGKFNFTSNYAFIQARDNCLFVGRDSKISCISISRK